MMTSLPVMTVPRVLRLASREVLELSRLAERKMSKGSSAWVTDSGTHVGLVVRFRRERAGVKAAFGTWLRSAQASVVEMRSVDKSEPSANNSSPNQRAEEEKKGLSL